MPHAAALLPFAAFATAAPTHPKFPQQWTAVETIEQVINQGGKNEDGKACCGLDAAQCKIQTAHQKAHHYFDQPNQRARTGRAGTSGATISLYDKKKEVQVDENNNCTSYCPLQSSKLGRFHIDVNATYAGKVTIDGIAADMWTWKEYS
eukprot:gene789-1186_t